MPNPRRHPARRDRPGDPLREAPATDRRRLRDWIRRFLSIELAPTSVCHGHAAPWRIFEEVHLHRPPLALLLGPRGGGKSFLSALDTHLTSRWYPGHGTRILGGSKAQSEQIYRALRDLVRGETGEEATVSRLLRAKGVYRNGSEVELLAASPTSVRGPHVPSLKLDEVDEIDTDLRESSMGMCMNRKGHSASVLMTSTWHRTGGPMANLMERANAGDFPLYSFCAFEILERCPDARSGKNLEKCPECPLVRWCHADRDRDPLGRPKAKRSDGHYSIDALIQKARATSVRTFEADYLCRGPKADGLWFPAFDPDVHVDPRAEFDPRWLVHVAVDSGVFTGAVFFQVVTLPTPTGPVEEVHVFGDYLQEGHTAEQNARAIRAMADRLCQGRIDSATTDPNGGSRNPVGPTVIAEFERAGLRPLNRWPHGHVADGLALVESFLQPADGRPRLLLHPRCRSTTQAIQGYRRARRGGQWQDYPEDPQHPHEDLVDSLRGGLRSVFPEGRCPPPNLARIPARRVF